ncbi:putative bifunctional diguanylate cyclase/phosphodiesterase [Devosia sp. RR2S18]|uniref:putative bifunctional diguanylate cyclase/phosphodiesterase n=1 Tax=Devosia rhizosphaerae TaxID=3049774 RepID=UPI0025416B28|nr:EAL domain-containing protein [Devosia sp. RR2S18]WIJ23899.1 EAL domain-containing protein [Devosia sp. RR2S18]
MVELQQDDLASQDVWRHAIERAQLGLWDWDLTTDRCFYSASWFAMLGYSETEFRHDSALWLHLTHPEDRERAVRSGERHLAGETGSIETELRLRHRDGRWIWVLDRGGIIERDASGRPLRAVGVQTDISRQKAAEAELADANAQIRLALEASSMGLWQFDIDTQKSLWDGRTREIFGLPPVGDELAREAWHAFLHPEDRERTEQAHAIPVSPDKPTRIGYRIIRADGHVRHVETLCKLHRLPGTSGRLVGTIRDVTEEHERQQQLATAARQDPLTGLLNRGGFEDVLTRWIAEAAGRPFGLYYIDLDFFKAINDTLGHAAGDAALRGVATRVGRAMPMAVMARLGGDEFAVALPLADEDPTMAAQSMLTAIRQVGPHTPQGQRQLGASIGVAIINSPHATPAEILARADDACYAAKSGGRNTWHLETEGQASSGMSTAQLVAELTIAMEDGRLRLFGQEIRALERPEQPTGRVEVLSRLLSRQGHLIAPGDFLPAAERFGMAAALDRYVIRTALKTFGQALGRGANLTLSFNLSAHTLSDPMLWDFVATVAEQTGAALNRLEFEITETAAFTNIGAAELFVTEARSRGCRVSLDDFGAGLSSFSYLRRFAVDSVKVDQSFVQNVESSPFDREVIKSLAAISRSMGVDVIAEGIETPAALAALLDQDLHITLGQGFLLHRPEPLAQVVARLVPGAQVKAVQPALL